MIRIEDGWLSGTLPDDTGHEWPIIQHRQTSSRGPLAPGTPNLILHTTETDRYLPTLKFPSQWQCGEGQIGQHIKLGLAGDAVNDWDRFAQQIEMVGRSQVGRWLPAEMTLGPTVALTAWLHKAGHIKTGLERPADWPVVVDQLPAAVTDYYRRKAGVWPGTPGVYGHIEIPGNSHWDPGGFDYPRFFERVKAMIEGGQDVADFADYVDGVDRFWAAWVVKDGDPGGAPQALSPMARKGWTHARRGALNPQGSGGQSGIQLGDTVKLVKPI